MAEEPTRTLHQAVLSAWQDELKATPNPIIKEQCLQQEPDLLPRFFEHYQELKALPRRMHADAIVLPSKRTQTLTVVNNTIRGPTDLPTVSRQ